MQYDERHTHTHTFDPPPSKGGIGTYDVVVQEYVRCICNFVCLPKKKYTNKCTTEIANPSLLSWPKQMHTVVAANVPWLNVSRPSLPAPFFFSLILIV